MRRPLNALGVALRLVRRAALLMLPFILVSESYAGFGVYQPSRYYASPVGEVRWFEAAPGLLLISDLKQGIAAVELSTGKVRWTHTASGGRLDNVWKVGERLVVSGVDFEVLDRNTGEVIWGDVLSCPTGGVCASQIHHVDRTSVYFSGTGRVHTRLWRLGLDEGRAQWKKSAVVNHPRHVWANDKHLIVEEAMPPFTIRVLDKETGEPKRTWSWSRDKGPKPSDIIRLQEDGTVMAIRLGAGDGSLAKIARISGKSVSEVTVFPGNNLATRAVWALATTHAFFALVPQPRGDGVSLAYKRLAADELQVTSARLMDTPQLIDGHVLVHTHDGRDSILSAYDAHSARKMYESKIATPERHAQILPAGSLGIAILEGRPRPFMVVSPARRKLLGVGSLVQQDARVSKVMNIGATLYVAEGRGIQGYALRTMDYVLEKLRQQLDRAEVEDALLTWSSISLLAGTSPKVHKLLRAVTTQRFLKLRHLFEARERGQMLTELATEIGLRELGDPLYVTPRLRPMASLLADTILGAKGRFTPAEVGQLDTISARLQTLVRRHLRPEHSQAELDDFRSVVLTMAAILVKADAPASAADLLSAWMSATEDQVHGLGLLYRRVSLSAFAHLFEAIRYDLASLNDEVRRSAAQLLANFRHRRAALSGYDMTPMMSKILSKDHNRARVAAAELIDGVSKALKRVKKSAGKGLTRPGCQMVCDAIGATCLNRCRDLQSCSKATSKCRKRCGRGNKVRWSGPKGIPGADDEMRICD